jgi:hypothetical protein
LGVWAPLGTAWVNIGAIIARAVHTGDLTYDEITPEEAAAIISGR